MKIASYNIQNLFHRNIDLILKNQRKKKKIWISEFERLRLSENRSERDYLRMRELSELLGLQNTTYEPYISMKNLEGNLHVKSITETMDTKASSMTNWNGWIKLKSFPIGRDSIINKAKVILEANADILVLQEVESRDSLIEFNNVYLNPNQESIYEEIIQLEGNDTTGLGMGILLKAGYRVKAIRSFSSERDVDSSLLFDNDLQLYKVETPNYGKLFILCIQLVAETRSKEKSDAKRKRQSAKVAEVYQELQSGGHDNILIVGTFNAPSYSDSISPIIQTDVMDIVKHESFEVVPDTGDDAGYFRMGAYRKGVNIKQKDYFLISPTLLEQVSNSGMNRKAVWPLTKPEWLTYDLMQSESDAASDHPLLWANLLFKDSVRLVRKSA